jgi:outer membrane protein assembly factor BamB
VTADYDPIAIALTVARYLDALGSSAHSARRRRIDNAMPRLGLPLLLLILATSALGAQGWPQFRGPTGQGHATETGLPVEWSETKNVAWKTPVPGIGWSSPVIADGLVWLTTAAEVPGRNRSARSLRLLAFDAATGQQRQNIEVFALSAPEFIHQKNSYASPTPILDGDRIYVHFGAEGTAALTTKGEVLWKTKLAYQSQHGNGGSPVLYRDLLIINCDGNGGPGDAYVVALDVKTGKQRWKTTRRSPADQAYATSLVITVNGVDQLVSPGAYRATAYNPINGDAIWSVSYDDGFSNVPRPVFGHGLVYIATGFNQPTLIAVRPDGARGDVTRTHLAWTLTRGAPFTPSPLLVGDDLYVVSDTGILTIVEAKTGRIHGQHRLGGNYSASPVFADGRIYFQSEEGVTTVVAPGSQFQKLASNTLDGGMLASIAVADKSLFIRTERHLYRVSERR